MIGQNNGILKYSKRPGCGEYFPGPKKERRRYAPLAAVLLAVVALAGCVPAQEQSTDPAGKMEASLAKTAVKTVPPTFPATTRPTETEQPELTVTGIVSGEGHSCALISDGTVKCWGKNEFGQLGFGKTENRAIPVWVLDLTDVVELAAGWGHTCALTTRSSVYCWGYNRNGELGNSRVENSALPVLVPGLWGGVKTIATGDDHTCAVMENGEVMCWGFNESGQLGDGTTENRIIPVWVQGLPGKAIALAAGWGHTCALTEEGGVFCWGDNTNGQLGNGSGEANIPSPVAVGGLSNGVAAVTAKGGHTCALLEDGTVKCWGDNTYGQLGDGTAVDRKTPMAVTGLGQGIQSIAAGWNHTCVITETGGMKCWGWNYFGQLGDRSMTSQLKPVTVAGLPGPVTAMGLGWRHSCAVIDPGLVICWGANEYGQGWDGWLVEPGFPAETPTATREGRKTATPTKKPATPLPLDFHYQPMDAGGNHNCAVTKLGGVRCWGANDGGQMGIGSTGPRSVPVDVIGLSGEAIGVAAGGNHSCAVMRSGDVMCWGANYSAEIGDGTHADRKNPVSVIGLPGGATAVAAGGGHTCAVVPAGVMCWGANNHTQMGVVASGPWYVSTPMAVLGMAPGVRQLSTLSDHTCAVTREGAAVCWGYNGSGQLGDGTYIPRLELVPVTGLESGVISAAAGSDHSCAVLQNGTVRCWGGNAYGDLGNDSLQSSLSPVNVLKGEDKAVRVVAGFYHSCYLTDTGKVKCWGLNTDGQLGDGTFSTSYKPVEVQLPEEVLFLEAGDNHTCAITVGGSILCWGSNISGQLGNGETASSNVPVYVIWNG